MKEHKYYVYKNPEKRKAYMKIYGKLYRKAHIEIAKIYNKAWRASNKEKVKAYLKVNSQKIKLQKKAYNEANSDKNKAWCKSYLQTHPEKYRQYRHKRRALECHTQIEPINEKAVYLRDGWICQHCKKRVDKKLKWPNPMSPSLDHITPLTKGGSHIYKNVQLAHLVCNMSKHDRVLSQGEQLRIF